MGGKTKTIEERYQKKSQLEHILHRPDTYIGSIQRESQLLWIWSELEKRMLQRQITIVPGLFKIFDEILVNAADVKAREIHEGKKLGERMTTIKVDIDRESGTISVWNDGEGIPIEIHKEHGIYVPDLIFGHLLTSDNYDDDEERVTGGRNGFGAKLTNIFSKSFSVEVGDGIRGKKIRIGWKSNMSTRGEPRISDYSGDKSFVKITFQPDLQKFGMTSLASVDADDIISLMHKRAYDVAGTCGVKVILNGTRLPVNNFKNYVDLYFDQNIEPSSQVVKIHEKTHRWEVVISVSDGQFQHCAFVNSISTPKGGTHVNHVADQVIQTVLKKVSTKNKGGMDLKSHHIKNHLSLFVNCLVVNPTFDSQTKETLTLRASQFGSKCELSAKTLNAVIKSAIVENVLLWAQTKEQVELKKKMKGGLVSKGKDRISGIPKLEDANDAGTKKADQCTLIITEGDSAKTSCLAGLSVVGRDKYGIFPLRGKLLNVRDASHKQLIENKEIMNLLTITGLQVGQKEKCDTKGLRYGSVMIMTDQDFDGSHIKGLLINLMQKFWPNMLRVPGFLREFVTPIVKVTKKNGAELAFFTIPEYEEWKQKNDNGKGWRIKYYKGLGTSTDRDFKQYFSSLEQHQIDFEWRGPEDDESIDMAFNSKRTEDRKHWIQSYEEGTCVDHNLTKLRYKDFIDKELVLFSRYDTERSIPSVIDGCKPGQRKVLFSVFKKNLRNEMKVAQLAAYVAEHSSYHHGEQSLQSTIVNIAQDFVGSNNLNMLAPRGQFGSRKEGGKDASAPRYIYTCLNNATRVIFHESDDPLLKFQSEENQTIEPKFYIPVIPMVLVNGAEGIGTGWSSSVPNFNPRDIIANLRRYIRGEPMEPMVPWYRKFKGTIEAQQKGKGFECVGMVRKIDEETVEITELPVKTWTQQYREMLEEWYDFGKELEAGKKENASVKKDPKKDKKPSPFKRAAYAIVDFRDNSTHDDISFTVKLAPETLKVMEKEGLEKAFRLRKPMATSNMTLFDPQGKVQRYATELDIVREFAPLRLKYYNARKEYLVDKVSREEAILENKVRFIRSVTNGTLKVSNRKKIELFGELKAQAFKTMAEIQDGAFQVPDFVNTEAVEEENMEDDNEEDQLNTKNNKGYEYLLNMAIWSLTAEKIEELEKQVAEKRAELEDLRRTTPEDMWLLDLDRVEEVLDLQNKEDEESRVENLKFKHQRRQSLKTVGKGAPKRAAGRKQVAAKKAVKVSDREESLADSDSSVSDSMTSGTNRTSPTSRTSGASTKATRQPKPKAAPSANITSYMNTSKREKKDDDSPKPLRTFSLADRLKMRQTAPNATSVAPTSSVAAAPDLVSSEDWRSVDQIFGVPASNLDDRRPSANSATTNSSDDVPLAARLQPKAKAKARPKAPSKRKLDSISESGSEPKRAKADTPVLIESSQSDAASPASGSSAAPVNSSTGILAAARAKRGAPKRRPMVIDSDEEEEEVVSDFESLPSDDVYDDGSD